MKVVINVKIGGFGISKSAGELVVAAGIPVKRATSPPFERRFTPADVFLDIVTKLVTPPVIRCGSSHESSLKKPK